MIISYCVKLFFFMSLPVSIFCNTFDFDTSFNHPNGYAYVNPGITYANSYAFSQAVALDAHNNIVLAGSVNAENSANDDIVQTGIAIVRYLPNGQLDESFNTSETPGYVVTFLNIYQNVANALAIQSDGKIVVAGYSDVSNKLMVARYTYDGQLDTTFNDVGFYLGSSYGEVIYGVAIQSDGKIILIGGDGILFVYRFNGNGTIDTSFGVNGKKSIPIEFGYDSAFGRGIVLLEDGSMVGAGYFGNGSAAKMLVTFKLTSTGSVDTSFGDEGLATLLLGSSMYCDQIKVDALGKFVIGGGVTNASTEKVEALVVRYTQNGILDSFFNNGLGYVITPISDKSLDKFGGIVFDLTPENYPGYGIFYINYFNNSKLVIIKYNYDGSLNLDFADSGVYKKKINDGFIATDAVMQEDQKLVIGGRLYQNERDNFLAVRFLNNIIPNESTSLNQAIDIYGYNVAYIQDFLSANIYVQVISDLQIRNLSLQAMNEIIYLYKELYGSQPDFNYATNFYIMIPFIVRAQQVLLDQFPDQSAQINSFFSLILLRIKLLES